MTFMGGWVAMERRDPASGLLRLGVVLSALKNEHRSGVLTVEDQGKFHLASVSRGRIGDVYFNCDSLLHPTAAARPVSFPPEKLFSSVRPKISFCDRIQESDDLCTVTAEQVVLNGIAQRSDLFDPRPLTERIPVDVLKLSRETLIRAVNALESEAEKEFVWSLHIPTPVAMALWKRGLQPRHAGALIVGLNLLGCFPDWEPGDLPRMTAVAKLLRKTAASVSPYEILGVPASASREEIDRAFRRLSFDIHPDRFGFVCEKERCDATRAFESVSAAYAKIKSSRGSANVRPHRSHTSSEESRAQAACATEPWVAHWNAAGQAAAGGSAMKAKMFALRALSFSPPPHIAEELKRILRSCA